MQYGRDDNLGDLHDSINVAARELDASRAEALDAIERAHFSSVTNLLPSFVRDIVHSWFHVKVCLVAGTNFFTDA